MTVRTDVVIDWTVSPRIITVLSPSTEIVIQDLLDTCREAEDDLPNLIHKQIISAAGKENLGGGVKVGITVTLLNAVLAFEARPGPSYVQCRVSGGNLVAVDSVGADISPIYPTAFTQVITTASSSATLQEQTDIQYSSFNGGITVNLSSSYTGTEYPKGTERQPINNLSDALEIANIRGFHTFYIIGDLAIGGGLNFSGIKFVGESMTKTTLTIDPSANVLDCEFSNATIQGTLDGGCQINDCRINNLIYIEGFVNRSVLVGPITLGGESYFYDCWSSLPGNNAIINFNGTASPLAVRNYNGSISIQNKTGSQSAVFDLNSGKVIIDNTVTNGTIVVRGVGSLIDNSTGSAVVDSSNLLSYSGLNQIHSNQLLMSFIKSLS
jgi:cytoskeletal protein CcmA (bactofilin family)